MRRAVNRLHLGPIVGHTDHESTKIWIRVFDDPAFYQLRIQGIGRFDFVSTPGGGLEFGTAIASASGLRPDWRYRYQVLRRGRVVPKSKGAFRTAPHPRSMAPVLFAAISCSDNVEEGDWPRLASFIEEAEPRFLLLMGDQVYLDEGEPNVWSDYLDADPTRRRAAMAEKYQQSWSRPTVREVLANVPTYMMWDDHEIRDGWGSFAGDSPTLAQKYPAGAAITDRYRQYFEDARDVFWHFQMCRNPLPSYVSTSPFGYRRAIPVVFRYGRLQVLMLDGRGDRDVFREKDPILGTEQWDFVNTVLANVDREVDALAIVTPVPIVSDSPEGQAQFLLGHRTDDVEVYKEGKIQRLERVRTEGSEDFGNLLLAAAGGELQDRFGTSGNLGSFKRADIDDIRDHWSHHFSRPEQDRLLRKADAARVTNRTASTARSLIFLGGDLHAGAVFELEIENDTNYTATCLVSSGISKRPDTDQLLFTVLDKEFEVADGIDARLLSVVNDYNYAVVHAIPTAHGAHLAPVLAHRENSYAWGAEASLKTVP